ncbi:DnaJ C-terminal domain-containing protein, partial [Rhizobium leguminosarum]|uniref:DnaJ C-terminal domain-containing protein n=1 Tax=Rhizobium leguminosarum TaxID=384 RepID=UPI003F994669
LGAEHGIFDAERQHGVQIETIDGPSGPLNVTIPEWSGSDKTIRIPGQGLPSEEGGRGELVVEWRIILWEKPDDKIT